MNKKMIRTAACCVLIISATACGTTPKPQIEAFSTASTIHLDSMDAFFKSNKSVAVIEEKRLKSIASENARYDIAELNCEVLRPINWKPEDKIFFLRDRCNPLLVTAQDDAKIFAPTDDGILIPSAAQRLALSRGLRSYAAALSKVATAEDEGKLVSNLSGAITASQGLANTVALFQGSNGLKPSVVKTIETGGTFASALAERSLEQARYRALSEIVTTVQETEAVQIAANALAIHVGRVEKIELDKKYDAFLDAFDRQQDIADDEAFGVDDRIKALTAFEKATLELQEADAARTSINLAKIGTTHTAIAESFNAPQSLDSLIAAQEQILDLVEKADATVKAAEDV